MAQNDIIKAGDPFNVMGKHDNPYATPDPVPQSAEENPYASNNGQEERIAEGAFGTDFAALAQDKSDLGFFGKPIGEFEATEADWVDQIKMAAGMMFTFDEQDQIDVIKNTLTDANFRVDESGSTIVSYRGEEGFVNKPGASWRDFASVAGTLLSFTPAFRTAKYATTVAGKSAIVGVANTMTDATLQGTVSVLGGEKEADVERALIAGVVGGGSIAVVDKVAKIAAPLIKARGVKKAKKIVDKVGIHMRKFEQQNMNPEEAFDRALTTMRLSSIEAQGLSTQAGKEITKASAKQLALHDAKVVNKFKDWAKAQPLLTGFTDGMRKAFVPMSTTLNRIAPGIAGGVRRMMHNVHADMIATEKRVDPFLKGIASIRKSDPEKFRALKQAITAGDVHSVEKLMLSSGNKTQYEDVRIVLDEMQDYIRSVGGKADVTDFFPRVIQDYTKLASTLTGKEYGAISTAIERAQGKIGHGGKELDAVAITKIINSQLKEIGKGWKSATRTSKSRTMKNIQDDLLDH